jgi:hypothetical protein
VAQLQACIATVPLIPVAHGYESKAADGLHCADTDRGPYGHVGEHQF